MAIEKCFFSQWLCSIVTSYSMAFPSDNMGPWQKVTVITDTKQIHSTSCRAETECDGTQWRTGGEVKGKEANGVGVVLQPLSERGLSSITTNNKNIRQAG